MTEAPWRRALGVLLCTLYLVTVSSPVTWAQPPTTSGDCSPVVIGTQGDVTIDVHCPISLSPAQLKDMQAAFAAAVERATVLQGPLLDRITRLSGELGVRTSALENFFRILGTQNVPAADLDRALRQIAKRHLDLTARLDRSSRTDDPQIRDLLSQAADAVEAGAYDRADAVLAQAEALDLDAIAAAEAALDTRKRRAAETRAERAELRSIVFDYIGAAEYFAAAADLVPADDPLAVAGYANRAGQAYQKGARYAQAEVELKRSLTLREGVLTADDARLGVALNNLAELYRTTGRYAAAEPLYTCAVAITEKALGPDHPKMAIRLNNQAELYSDIGRYEAAEPLYVRALAITEETLGPDHPEVGILLNNMAVLYRVTGRYEAAEPLSARALEITGKALGPDHPDVAIRLNNQAWLYRATGRDAAAEPLYARALAIMENALGLEHPHTQTVRANLKALRDREGAADAAAIP